MILAISLLLIYGASAWVMLRSVDKPRLDPIAWTLSLAAIVAHSDAIVHMMRINGPFSIGLFEAISLLAWTLAVLACLICIERQNRVLGAILLASAALGAAATGTGHTPAEPSRPCCWCFSIGDCAPGASPICRRSCRRSTPSKGSCFV